MTNNSGIIYLNAPEQDGEHAKSLQEDLISISTKGTLSVIENGEEEEYENFIKDLSNSMTINLIQNIENNTLEAYVNGYF